MCHRRYQVVSTLLRARRVYFFAWFNANEELLKIEWVCETGDEMVFRPKIQTYSGFGSVPMNLTVPAFVDLEKSGGSLQAAFVPQTPEPNAEGWGGYANELADRLGIDFSVRMF